MEKISNSQSFFNDLFTKKYNYEDEHLDYKLQYHFSKKRDQLQIVKDIVSFANTDGGVIVFGVRDKTYDWEGLDDESDELNDLQINSQIKEYIGQTLPLKCGRYTSSNNNVFYLITIEKLQSPLPFIKDGTYSRIKKGSSKEETYTVFKKGSFYGRVASSSLDVSNDLFFFEKRDSCHSIITNLNEISRPYTKYVERTKEKTALIKALNNPNIRNVRVNGIGGIGKTSFVRNFCDSILSGDIKMSFAIDAIVWVTGKITLFTPTGDIQCLRDTTLSYREMLVTIANALFIDHSETKDNELRQLIYERMLHYPTLLILDNMETINDKNIIDFYQNIPLNCRIIFTSRTDLATSFTRLDIEGFDKEQFLQYIKNNIEEYCPNDYQKVLELVEPHAIQFKDYTRGSPILMSLIMHKICNGHNINPILSDLKSLAKSENVDSVYYNSVMEFCFNDTFDSFSSNELEVLFIMSISDDETEEFELSDFAYILQKNQTVTDEILSKIHSCSFCVMNDLKYSCPPLIKAFVNKKINDKKNIDINLLADRYYEWKRHKEEVSSKTQNFYERIKAYSLQRKIITSEWLKIKNEYLDTHSLEEVVEKFDDLISESPDFGFLYFEKAKYLKEIPEIANSVVDSLYKKAIELEPTSDYFISEYAFHLNQRGDVKNASRYFRRAYELAPHLPNINHGYAVCLSKLYFSTSDNNIDKNEVIKLFESGYVRETKRFGDKVRFCSNAHQHSLFLFKLGLYDDALLVADRALEIMPFDDRMLGLKGNILKKINPDSVTQTQIRKNKKGLFAGIDDEKMRQILEISNVEVKE